jgi:uncharacterized membrane protein
MKNTAQSMMGMETQNYPVVLAPVDGWMFAFIIENLPDNEIVVFVPDSPSPWSGSVMVFDRKDVKPTALTQKEALSILRHTGIGLKDLKKTAV